MSLTYIHSYYTPFTHSHYHHLATPSSESCSDSADFSAASCASFSACSASSFSFLFAFSRDEGWMGRNPLKPVDRVLRCDLLVEKVSMQVLYTVLNSGPCKVRNETETKRNETKQIETKRNNSKRNETDRNETKQIETKRIKTKRNKSKRNETCCMERQHYTQLIWELINQLESSAIQLESSLYEHTIREHTNSFTTLCNWIRELSNSIKNSLIRSTGLLNGIMLELESSVIQL